MHRPKLLLSAPKRWLSSIDAPLNAAPQELEAARENSTHSRRQVEAVRAMLNMDTECARATVQMLQAVQLLAGFGVGSDVRFV